jgi:hypothetical protein
MTLTDAIFAANSFSDDDADDANEALYDGTATEAGCLFIARNVSADLLDENLDIESAMVLTGIMEDCVGACPAGETRNFIVGLQAMTAHTAPTDDALKAAGLL